MPQAIIGHSDSILIGNYKVVIGKENRNLFNTMQSNPDMYHVHKKSKRFRIAFTTEQTNYLEELFKKSQYINREEREKVASILKIREKPIKIWFQNRRMKEKKENYKVFDDETCGNVQNLCTDQLNNVPALPSTNDHRLYSLLTLPFTTDTTTYACTKKEIVNIDENSEKIIPKPESPKSMNSIEQKNPRANFYKELISQEQEHVSPYFSQQPIIDSSLPLTKNDKNKNSLSHEYKNTTSAEFSINLCKKYKQQAVAAKSDNIDKEDQNIKNESQEAMKKESNNIPEDLTLSKKFENSYPMPSKQTQMNLSNPMYYPIMPSIYTPPMNLPSPYVAPDGVLWKPVNFMPVVTTNPMDNITHRMSQAHEQFKNCICNCHGSSQNVPASVSPSVHNPYAYYIITVPNFTSNQS